MSYLNSLGTAAGGQRRYVPRFATEAFLHRGHDDDPPMLRKLASEVVWKRPPSSDVQGQVST